MAIQNEEVAHAELVNGGETTLHSHAGGGSVDFKPYKVYDSTGEQALDSGTVVINLDSELISNANYSLASDEITINEAGLYQISYTTAITQSDTSGGTRSMQNFWMESDDSGSYSEIIGSFIAIYSRETCIDENGGNNATFLFEQTQASKKLRIRSVSPLQTGTHTKTLANRTSVSIIKIGE